MRTKKKLSKTIFRTRPLSKCKMKKQTRGKLVTAAAIDVRVFFFDFFGEKCSKMKNEKNGEKGPKKNIFKNDFQNEATLKMENEKANTWRACYSRRHRFARVIFPFLR